MGTALVSFENELEKLGGFLDGVDAEERVLAAVFRGDARVGTDVRETLETARRYSTIKRRQGYVSSIIVLYGALERYVEESVGEYTQTLMRIYQDYDNLPEKLRQRHTSLTIEYLNLVKDGRVRETETIGQIVDTLNACLNRSDEARLNARAFLMRSANMKWERIRQAMINVDVTFHERRVLATPAYSRYLSEMHGIRVSDMDESEVRATLEHIDELVCLRNDIAHGVADLSTIEDVQIVRERAAKLGAFAVALDEILSCELLEARLEMDRLVRVEGTVQVFGDHVACFSWPRGRLAVGDVLVMKPAKAKADLRHGPIGSIKVDGKDRDVLEGADGLMVGVKVPFRAKANGAFYVWSGDD